jgi:hypothetical protein
MYVKERRMAQGSEQEYVQVIYGRYRQGWWSLLGMPWKNFKSSLPLHLIGGAISI